MNWHGDHLDHTRSGCVAGLAQRVLVMYGGYIIEESSMADLFANPSHPYTVGLLGSLPRVDEKEHGRLYSIEASPLFCFRGRVPVRLPRAASGPLKVLEGKSRAGSGLGWTPYRMLGRHQNREKPLMNSQNEILLKVEDLKMHFPIYRGVFQRQVGAVHAVDGVSFDVKRGETLGLVGESGCGKTTTGRAILQLYKPTAGKVYFDGADLISLKREEMRWMRRQIQMIFQDPMPV